MDCKQSDCYYCTGGTCTSFAILKAQNCGAGTCPFFLTRAGQNPSRANPVQRRRIPPRAQQMASIRARMEAATRNGGAAA